MKFFLVFLGAGIGGGLRYWLSAAVQKLSPLVFPFGTLTVNVLGSLILGFLIFGLDEKNLLSSSMKLLLGVGLCGGFTTFSTFSLETVQLLRNAEYFMAAINIFLNLFLTIAAVLSGYVLARNVL